MPPKEFKNPTPKHPDGVEIQGRLAGEETVERVTRSQSNNKRQKLNQLSSELLKTKATPRGLSSPVLSTSTYALRRHDEVTPQSNQVDNDHEQSRTVVPAKGVDRDTPEATVMRSDAPVISPTTHSDCGPINLVLPATPDGMNSPAVTPPFTCSGSPASCTKSKTRWMITADKEKGKEVITVTKKASVVKDATQIEQKELPYDTLHLLINFVSIDYAIETSSKGDYTSLANNLKSIALSNLLPLALDFIPYAYVLKVGMIAYQVMPQNQKDLLYCTAYNLISNLSISECFENYTSNDSMNEIAGSVAQYFIYNGLSYLGVQLLSRVPVIETVNEYTKIINRVLGVGALFGYMLIEDGDVGKQKEMHITNNTSSSNATITEETPKNTTEVLEAYLLSAFKQATSTRVLSKGVDLQTVIAGTVIQEMKCHKNSTLTDFKEFVDNNQEYASSETLIGNVQDYWGINKCIH